MHTFARLLLVLPAVALALPPVPPGEAPTPPTAPCLEDATLRLSASSPNINLGEAITLRWHVDATANCPLGVKLDGQTVARVGSLVVTPQATTRYSLSVRVGNVSRIASADVAVRLPSVVTIQNNNQKSLLIQALGTAGTTVYVNNNVEMDLTHSTNITIAQGVRLFGFRTPRVAGARLFTTSRPSPLFAVAGDGVRISGLRIVGPQSTIAEDDSSLARGIVIDNAIDFEISNCEISAWPSSGIYVSDSSARISPTTNPDTIRIRGNFIHHNQFTGRQGYGVVMGQGAYARIEENVFDYNRHAIASTGKGETGYTAAHNLVLENGGFHRSVLGATFYTHQFDMHGADSCGIGSWVSDTLYNCGQAGHSLRVEGNSFLYTRDAAFKLRGTPTAGPGAALVTNNVFAHSSLDSAVQQTESGLRTEGNTVGYNGMRDLGSCDFDGDGVLDTFLATGRTWWFSSAGTSPWAYLNASTLKASELSFGNFDSRLGCDIAKDGVIWSGGRPSTPGSMVSGPPLVFTRP
jgi:hypothetical protein